MARGHQLTVLGGVEGFKGGLNQRGQKVGQPGVRVGAT